MAASEVGGSREPSGSLDQRVLSALQGLPGRVAFSGLRRILHAHPESLSRSLRRLEREGLVERLADGYRALGAFPEAPPFASTDVRSIAEVELPPGTTSDSVFGRLTGRWFGSLRWVGVVNGPAERLLVWARRDGTGHVLMGIHQRHLRVYVREEPFADDSNEAEDAAYELLAHAVEALRPSFERDAETVRYLAVSPRPTLNRLDN